MNISAPRLSLSSLQILRGLAALLVVYYHIDTPILFGSFGVEVFFVISGFVMALIIDRQETAQDFAINRFSRIAPLYWVMTLCVLVVSAIKPDWFNSTQANLGNFLKSILFIPYFKENGSLMPMLAVGWTLNYEVFFYLLILAAIMVHRRYYAWLVSASLIALHLYFASNADMPILQAFLGNPVIYTFILGLLAYQLYKMRILDQLPTALTALICVGSLVWMMFAEYHYPTADRMALFQIPAMVLVWTAVHLDSWVSHHSSVVLNVFKKIGDASYAIYLSHFFVVQGFKKVIFTRLSIQHDSLLGIVLILGCSILVGYGLYICLDRPLNQWVRTQLSRLKRV